MIEDIKALSKHTFIYGVGGVVNGLVRVAFVPIVASYLAPDAFGVYSLLLTVVSFLILAFDVGLSYALMRWHSESDNEDARGEIVGTALTSLIAIGGTICVLALLLSVPLSRLLFRATQYASFVRMAAVIALLGAVFQLLLSALRAAAQSRRFVLFTSVRGVANVILTCVFVLCLSMRIEGFLWGALLSFALGIGAFVTLSIPRMVLSFRRAGDMLKFGLPLMPSNLALWLLTYADLYLLRTLAGFHEVGLYQFAQEMCVVISLLLVSFERAWPQFIFSRWRRDDAGQIFSRVFSLFFAVCVLFGLGLSLFRTELLSLLSAGAYRDATSVIPLLACSGVLYGTYYVFGTGLLIREKTSLLPLITLCAALSNILLNLVLIPAYGIVGAGLATVVTNAVMAVATLLLSQKYYAIPFNLREMCAIGVVALVAHAVGSVVHASPPVSLFLKAILLIGFGAFASAHVLLRRLEEKPLPKAF